MRLFCLIFVACALEAGAICEFKIKQAREGVAALETKKEAQQESQKEVQKKAALDSSTSDSSKYDESKLNKARAELAALESSCDDEAILKDVRENIALTKSNLDKANENLARAMDSKDSHKIFQARLEQKLAHAQYIAARQEELRLKDLQKSAGK
ncbi:hypothetical protein BKN38_08235 [Helicobacter sp. CLO-3]|uniref:hypothetical protein n=1 Tax=unclassified Helicobacter TaxID=2593540 RepID=UPI000805D83B|nr:MULTISPECIES: hypothetical protein [unclassified Helicobacter]OBV28579.1 hypothetical protein BA723_08850 [Helicobacter sp. CLO-3]OHU81786.1 hypothetical protein BKN38_08235 [Helicobacter sp. CLO-3]